MNIKLARYIILRLAFLTGCLMAMAWLAANVWADEVYATPMVGVFNSGKDSLSETKMLNFGVRETLWPGLLQQFEGGMWVDIAGHGRSDSFYGAYQVGVEASHVITARLMFGPALISSPDAYLGGPFQFTEDFFLGIRGDEQTTIGVIYKHISSAGLEQPNMGRDFMGVQAAVRF